MLIENKLRDDKDNKMLISHLLEESTRKILEKEVGLFMEGDLEYSDAGTDVEEVDASTESVDDIVKHGDELS